MSLANSKTYVSLLGTGVTNGATVTANIDTFGIKGPITIELILGTTNTPTNTLTTLKLAQSDDTVVTNFANISGFVGGTDFTIANQSSSVANVYRFDVDTRGRKRYIKLSASPVTTQEMVVVAKLGKPEAHPDTATEAGVTQLVQG